ncbi:hypothetical protein ES703_65647 [subsurface metagenome]
MSRARLRSQSGIYTYHSLLNLLLSQGPGINAQIIYGTKKRPLCIVSVAYIQWGRIGNIPPPTKTITGRAAPAGDPALIAAVDITANLRCLAINHHGNVYPFIRTP